MVANQLSFPFHQEFLETHFHLEKCSSWLHTTCHTVCLGMLTAIYKSRIVCGSSFCPPGGIRVFACVCAYIQYGYACEHMSLSGCHPLPTGLSVKVLLGGWGGGVTGEMNNYWRTWRLQKKWRTEVRGGDEEESARKHEDKLGATYLTFKDKVSEPLQQNALRCVLA